MKHRGELGFLTSVTSGTEYRQLERQLRAEGWDEAERERLTASLAAADLRLSGSR